MTLVSALVPVYNAQPYLAQALASLLAQDAELEILAVDDGSTDESWAILQAIADPRLKTFRLATNRGAAAARNLGLDEARGDFLAFLDADDLALPGRFRAQLAAFEADAELAILGGGTPIIDSQGLAIRQDPPVRGHTRLRWIGLFNSGFAASAVMVRAAVVAAHRHRFRDDWIPAEDYGFFATLLGWGRGDNLAQPLAEYRIHQGQVTKRRDEALRQAGNRISQTIIKDWLGLELPLDAVFLLRHLHAFGRSRLGEGSDAALRPLVDGMANLMMAIFLRFKTLPGLEKAELDRIEAELIEVLGR
jgi:glycosyltransferase involved in cell wall biosynthesis